MTEHGVTVQGTYGSVTINADGSYTYNLDNSNTAVHNLDGAPLTDTFSSRYLTVMADTSHPR